MASSSQISFIGERFSELEYESDSDMTVSSVNYSLAVPIIQNMSRGNSKENLPAPTGRHNPAVKQSSCLKSTFKISLICIVIVVGFMFLTYSLKTDPADLVQKQSFSFLQQNLISRPIESTNKPSSIHTDEATASEEIASTRRSCCAVIVLFTAIPVALGTFFGIFYGTNVCGHKCGGSASNGGNERVPKSEMNGGSRESYEAHYGRPCPVHLMRPPVPTGVRQPVTILTSSDLEQDVRQQSTEPVYLNLRITPPRNGSIPNKILYVLDPQDLATHVHRSGEGIMENTAVVEVAIRAETLGANLEAVSRADASDGTRRTLIDVRRTFFADRTQMLSLFRETDEMELFLETLENKITLIAEDYLIRGHIWDQYTTTNMLNRGDNGAQDGEYHGANSAFASSRQFSANQRALVGYSLSGIVPLRALFKARYYREQDGELYHPPKFGRLIVGSGALFWLPVLARGEYTTDSEHDYTKNWVHTARNMPGDVKVLFIAGEREAAYPGLDSYRNVMAWLTATGHVIELGLTLAHQFASDVSSNANVVNMSRLLSRKINIHLGRPSASSVRILPDTNHGQTPRGIIRHGLSWWNDNQ